MWYIPFVYELIIAIKRKFKRRQVYKMALERSKKTGLPLLVVGDPYNGLTSILTGCDYGCGDVCLDLNGCPKCPKSIKGSLEDVLPTINLDEYVVFISCVLEYVTDIQLVVNHLSKMNHENLFIVNVEWYCLTSYFYPYFLTGEQPPRNIIYNCPPWTKEIVSCSK